jgi:MoxR-like ATPase
MVNKRQIEAALTEYNVRAACTIVDLGVLMLDLIDVQSPAVLEALVEEAQRRHVTGPKNRQEVRETLIRYCEYRLREARDREHQLYHGLTGK